MQEINISTGKVLFQWDSAGHVPYRDSQVPIPSSASRPWDWFHINAVHLDTDGNLFVGWGALGYISEFSPSGQLLFNAELPAGMSTYRAYRLPWHSAS